MNHLAREKSPYLKQHVENPVDWYPWSVEAFAKASREGKPIFLSIGYSTCHWCHVMAHESFEDADVAKLMNETFVSIKVDREERPDLDNLYMTVCQRLTGSGGWPLTIFLTPDKKPFFAGTYFPKKTRFGRIGLLELIPQVGAMWRNRRQDVLSSAAAITGEVMELAEEISSGASAASRTNSRAALDPAILDVAFRQFSERFDPVHGGFGTFPKFPTPHHFYFLLGYWKRTGNARALEMVEKSLQAMRAGGIWDHAGFGFHRYSVDAEWRVPHFEKMLYDQALIAIAYLETYQATGKKEYAETARQIFAYAQRDLKHPDGAFYSSEDADSEGEEGKFYLWTQEEIRKILPPDEAEFAIEYYQVASDGNFFDEASRQKTGKNILYRKTRDTPLLENQNLDLIRQKLFDYRAKRVRPHRDEKILADWNGLMIAALAKGGRILQEPLLTGAAEKTAQFVLSRLRDSKGRLFHRYCDGEAAIPGFANDYAFLIWGFLELHETTKNKTYLERAIELQKILTDHFWDNEHGGYYFTPDDGEPLFTRQKEIYDGAIPSGNSVALLNLLKIRDRSIFPEEQADQLIQCFAPAINAAPIAYTQFLTALFLAWPQCGPSGCAT